jgi:hypothetical protein
MRDFGQHKLFFLANFPYYDNMTKHLSSEQWWHSLLAGQDLALPVRIMSPSLGTISTDVHLTPALVCSVESEIWGQVLDFGLENAYTDFIYSLEH